MNTIYVYETVVLTGGKTDSKAKCQKEEYFISVKFRLIIFLIS